MEIQSSKINLNIVSGLLLGDEILNSKKHLKDLKGVFKNGKVQEKLEGSQLVYQVQAYLPVEEGKSGGLFFGNSTIYPGKVDGEYFMTRGHFHESIDTAEYYWCIQGEGMLILMEEDRKVRAEKMLPGSLHYIPGKVAHRVANTGKEKLVFNACWPSDAGHNYAEINKNGFSARLFDIDGTPTLIAD